MTATKITFEYNENGDQATIKINGELSAATLFPVIPSKQVNQVIINLEQAGYVNSDGVQSWIRWIQDVQFVNGNVAFKFQMLPSNYARLAYQVRGFLPEQSTVESVIIPYFCPRCSNNFTINYIKGVNWDKTWPTPKFIEKISHANCIACQAPSELDAIAEVYESLNT